MSAFALSARPYPVLSGNVLLHAIQWHHTQRFLPVPTPTRDCRVQIHLVPAELFHYALLPVAVKLKEFL